MAQRVACRSTADKIWLLNGIGRCRRLPGRRVEDALHNVRRSALSLSADERSIAAMVAGSIRLQGAAPRDSASSTTSSSGTGQEILHHPSRRFPCQQIERFRHNGERTTPLQESSDSHRYRYPTHRATIHTILHSPIRTKGQLPLPAESDAIVGVGVDDKCHAFPLAATQGSQAAREISKVRSERQ